jgi:hypothetical protein
MRLARGGAAALLIAACMGDEPAAEPAAQAAPAADDAIEAAPTPPEAASVRLINLWVDSGQVVPVDVFMRPLMGEDSPFLEGLPPGTVTSVQGIPADVQLDIYREGTYGSDDDVGGLFLTETDLQPSDRLMLVIGWTRPLREGGKTAGIDIFFESGQYITGTMPARSVDGGLLVAYVSPLNRVLGENGETLTFGVPGQGCLRPAGSPPPSGGGSAITTSLGGTAAITYDVPPGTHSVAAWRPGSSRCEGDPLIGPVEVTVAAGQRSWVFAWGTGADDMRLVGVPPAATD